jgi:phosphatidylinositol glycan class T
VHLPFSKSFIRYGEHPPDASRGFDLPPAILHIADSQTRSDRRRVYSSKLLVDVATPDFSMPYNVIIMTCTLIALFFGSVFNPLVRRFGVVKVDVDPVGELDEGGCL